MVNIGLVYEGGLRCRLTHGPSGNKISTDAPKDNMGKGEAFSPTDLVASALGSCMLTTMAIVAARKNISFEKATAEVTKEMVSDPERRLGKITVMMQLPASLSQEERALLERAAHTCPVQKSLHPSVETPATFQYTL